MWTCRKISSGFAKGIIFAAAAKLTLLIEIDDWYGDGIIINIFLSEQAESLDHLEQEYWKERSANQGYPHVQQWLQHLDPDAASNFAIKQELNYDNGGLPIIEADPGDSKRVRLNSPNNQSDHLRYSSGSDRSYGPTTTEYAHMESYSREG